MKANIQFANGFILIGFILTMRTFPASASEAEKGPLAITAPHTISLHFSGPMQERIQANLEHWLLVTPDANPGMIEMFHQRDRKPEPALVPWAGEFVGKYLISAIQAQRMTDDPRLDLLLQRVVKELIASQAEDGYLGPFKKEGRLLGNWDLWGHYHCMTALLLWHEATGDTAARDCAIRAADLICKTYLDTNRRILDMGSHEMNHAVIHVLGRLYRETHNERYLQLMKKIVKEWEESGDYFRTGLQGIDYYKTPRPRWESLHDIQGLTELYRISGQEEYKKALVNIWRSIARFDRHNTGGFSTFEQAIGDPYTPGAIETCCTIAWAALTLDMLLLTGDSTAADELEWSTWNSILGSQHPSGRWSTYDTPMDGVRQASAHSIVFQARAGTPELNCCSVNAPRGWGMLSEWAFLSDSEGVIVNYYGPVSADFVLPDSTPIQITEETAYPAEERVTLRMTLKKPAEFTLKLRIPKWSKKTDISVNNEEIADVEPGKYLAIRRTWSSSDRIEITFDFSIRSWVGDGHAAGKVSLYSGPLLLAFDSHFNAVDVDRIPPIDLHSPSLTKQPSIQGRFTPIVFFRYPGAKGLPVYLCDFATAGAYGTPYASWLPVTNAPPPPLALKQPFNGEKVPAGPIKFEWSGRKEKTDRTYTLIIAQNPDMSEPISVIKELRIPVHILNEAIKSGQTYYWTVNSSNANGDQVANDSPYSFKVDSSLPNPLAAFADNPALLNIREDGLLTASPLNGDGTPEYGCLTESIQVQPALDRFGNERGAVHFTGKSMLRYQLPYFPSEEYTFMVWVQPETKPSERLSQIVSAWARGGDDPLRIVLENDRLFGRMEGFTGANTKGIPIQYGEWMHVAAVKSGGRFDLYVNGALADSTSAPVYLPTVAEDFALGANPHYTGNEYFIGNIDEFAFYGKAMTDGQIKEIYMKR